MMRFRIKKFLQNKYNLSESLANIAMLGNGKFIEEAENNDMNPEAVAEVIYINYMANMKGG